MTQIESKLFSEEAESCEECLSQEFDLNESGAIKGPGKFEGEPLATYHAWHLILDGFSDDEIEDFDGTLISRVGNVIAQESESGFVYGSVFDSDGAAIERMAEIETEVEAERAAYAESED